MTRVSASEAKTHFAALLKRVWRGERIVITRHGAPVAQLVPAGDRSQPDAPAVVDRIHERRKSRKLGGLSPRSLKDEGRP